LAPNLVLSIVNQIGDGETQRGKDALVYARALRHTWLNGSNILVRNVNVLGELRRGKSSFFPELTESNARNATSIVHGSIPFVTERVV